MCWKLHPNLASYGKKKKKSYASVESEEKKVVISIRNHEVSDSSKVDEEIIFATVQKAEVNKEDCNVEEKKMQLVYIKIQAKKTVIDSIFDSSS